MALAETIERPAHAVRDSGNDIERQAAAALRRLKAVQDQLVVALAEATWWEAVQTHAQARESKGERFISARLFIRTHNIHLQELIVQRFPGALEVAEQKYHYANRA